MTTRADPVGQQIDPPPPVASGDVATLPVKHHGLLTLAVMMASIMQILDTTIANVALPHMESSLGATSETVTWALTSYLIASAIAIPITGWLSGRFGSRNLFIGAVIAFTFSSLLCGAATGIGEMVLFRALQGISSAFIGPLSQTVLMDINPPSRQARAMALWGMGIMIGPILGPVIGGWLTENYNWRWVFLINVPLGIITMLLMLWLLPGRPRAKRPFDVFGFSMLALGLASLQLVLDRGAQLDWLNSFEILAEGAIAITCFWVFGVHMLWGKKPLFDRMLLGNANMSAALLFMLVVGMVMFASMALLPPMLQQLFGYSALDTGLLVAPRGFGVLLSMGIAGRMVTRVDPRWLMVTGATISTCSLYMMTGWSLEMSWEPVILTGLIQGLGIGLVFIPLNMTAFSTLHPRYRTDGASLLNLSRSIGASVGISAMTALLGRNIQVSHGDLATHITDSSLSAIDSGAVQRLGTVGDAAMLAINGEINRQAAMVAYIDDFHAMMIINLCAIPLLLLLKRPAGVAGAPVHVGE